MLIFGVKSFWKATILRLLSSPNESSVLRQHPAQNASTSAPDVGLMAAPGCCHKASAPLCLGNQPQNGRRQYQPLHGSFNSARHSRSSMGSYSKSSMSDASYPQSSSSATSSGERPIAVAEDSKASNGVSSPYGA